jgi:hypothetical protein
MDVLDASRSRPDVFSKLYCSSQRNGPLARRELRPIDIAIRSVVATHNRAEHSGMRHAPLAQGALVTAKSGWLIFRGLGTLTRVAACVRGDHGRVQVLDGQRCRLLHAGAGRSGTDWPKNPRQSLAGCAARRPSCDPWSGKIAP